MNKIRDINKSNTNIKNNIIILDKKQSTMSKKKI